MEMGLVANKPLPGLEAQENQSELVSGARIQKWYLNILALAGMPNAPQRMMNPTSCLERIECTWARVKFHKCKMPITDLRSGRAMLDFRCSSYMVK